MYRRMKTIDFKTLKGFEFEPRPSHVLSPTIVKTMTSYIKAIALDDVCASRKGDLSFKKVCVESVIFFFLCFCSHHGRYCF
jgi:hypothetical protein